MSVSLTLTIHEDKTNTAMECYISQKKTICLGDANDEQGFFIAITLKDWEAMKTFIDKELKIYG